MAYGYNSPQLLEVGEMFQCLHQLRENSLMMDYGYEKVRASI